jgi:hypothetical protein
MSTKTREVIWGGRIMGAKMRADTAREEARKAARAALDAIRRARDTPIWKLEPSFRCRSCGTRRYKPPVRMIKLTEQRKITPYKWVHPDEER